MFGLHPRLGTDQALVLPGAFHGATESLRDGGQPFVMPLLLMPSFSTGDQRGFLSIANDSGMHFAKIDADHIGPWRWARLLAVFDDHMPGITAGLLLEHQTHFEHTQHRSQRRRQGDGERPVPLAVREGKHRTIFLDGGALPDRRTETLPPVGKLGVWDTSLAQGACRGTCPVEALLCRIDTMSMQGFYGQAAITPAGSSFFRQPAALVTHHAPVVHKHLGVDSPTGPVEGIGCRMGEMTGQDMRADHT